MRVLKRLGVTIAAFVVAGIFVALWREAVPAGAFSGVVMALIAVGIVFGTWKWTERLK